MQVGSVRIGGGAPIVVQSMTNTDTADARATADQVKALADAGSELVRITVNTPEAAAAVPEIRERFWKETTVLGQGDDLNQTLEYAGRVADFMEFADIMFEDGLYRDESCGCHLREEHQTEDGEAKRDDEKFTHVAAWEFKGVGEKPVLHKEELEFEYVKPTTRSYK